MPMIENTIAAARSSGARILFPGTIYNYGPDAFPVQHSIVQSLEPDAFLRQLPFGVLMPVDA
jgi:hypothetical protein